MSESQSTIGESPYTNAGSKIEENANTRNIVTSNTPDVKKTRASVAIGESSYSAMVKKTS